MTLRELITKVLEEAQKPLNRKQIWEIALSRGYTNQIKMNSDFPWTRVSDLLYFSIRDEPDSPFYTIGERPKLFGLKKHLEPVKEEVIISKKTKPDLTVDKKFDEKAMYPIFIYFANHILKIHLKIIDHLKSKKGSLNQAKWNYADIVGVSFPYLEWKDSTKSFGKTIGYQSIKLFSFELKKELSISTLKERFFQAVSNSSWAHEGYLVVAEIPENETLMNELRRLSNSFGIGVIRLEVNKPEDSQILLPAKTKDQLDWDTIDLLADDNSDFKDFLKAIEDVTQVPKMREVVFEKSMSKDEILRYARELKYDKKITKTERE